MIIVIIAMLLVIVFSFNNQPQIIHKRGFKSYRKIRAMLPIR